MLLLLLPSSIMALEDKFQRTELTRQERERRATIPLLRRLVSEQHHQQHQRCESDARIQQLQQEVDKLNVSNVQRLHAEAEAYITSLSPIPSRGAATPTSQGSSRLFNSSNNNRC
jgi:hypothetical protein